MTKIVAGQDQDEFPVEAIKKYIKKGNHAMKELERGKKKEERDLQLTSSHLIACSIRSLHL